MFIETHKLSNTTTDLAFIKSLNIQAFPCGRRRGMADFSNDTVQYIPFDPEARLNTEHNNRKYSSTNGYADSFINNDWHTDELSIVIAGYSFTIKLTDDINTLEDFVTALLTCLNVDLTDEEALESIDKIYANIRIEEIPLFSGYNNGTEPSLVYRTMVLRNQSDTLEPATNLDLLKPNDNVTTSYIENFDNYYFSGLSFSLNPITSASTSTYTIENITVANTGLQQKIVSLCIFVKDPEASWKLNERVKLPKITHGDEPNSVNMELINANTIIANEVNADRLTHAGKPTITLDVEELDSGKWQLQITHATTIPK